MARTLAIRSGSAIANTAGGTVLPRLPPDLEILTYRKTHVVAVQVFPSSARLHHLTKAGAHARTYVRVGSTNRRADEALIAEMPNPTIDVSSGNLDMW